MRVRVSSHHGTMLQELLAAFEEESLLKDRPRLLLSIAVVLGTNGAEDASTVREIER